MSNSLPLTVGEIGPAAAIGLGNEPPRCVAAARSLFLINGEHYSGAERVQDLLALRLPEEGFDVAFACLKPGAFSDYRQAREAPLFDVPMRSRVDLLTIRQLRRIVQQQQIGLLHAHTPRSLMVGSLLGRWTGLPLVYHVHSPVSRDSERAWQNWWNSHVERISLHGVRHLITVSHSLAQYMLAQGWHAESLSVVHNGVPPARATRDSRAPVEEWTLGTVALFRPRKGVELLLDALRLLRDEGRPVRLRAVGGFETPAYEAHLRAHAENLRLVDAVEWVGFTKEVDLQLARMDLFVLPSLYGEGLPMVLLESMSAGLPVVASNVEGVPEALRHGIDGVLVEPGQAPALARGIARIMDGDYDWLQLRSSAQNRYRELFSDRSMARGVAGVYRTVLAHPPQDLI